MSSYNKISTWRLDKSVRGYVYWLVCTTSIHVNLHNSAEITNTKVQGDLLLCNIEKVTLGVRILVCCGGLL